MADTKSSLQPGAPSRADPADALADACHEFQPVAVLANARHQFHRAAALANAPQQFHPASALANAPQQFHRAAALANAPQQFHPAAALANAPQQFHSASSEKDPTVELGKARHEFGEHRGVNMSIEVSTTFVVEDSETMERIFSGELGSDDGYFIYSRHCNPTILKLSHQIATLEGTEAAYCTSSGMAAISSVLLQLCSSGGHVVAAQTMYGGTHALLKHFLPRVSKVTTTFVKITDHKAVNDAMVKGKTNVLLFEGVSNPTLIVADIPSLSKMAHDKDVTVVVDNTFTPMVLSPARLGADVVVHSLTKFISGGEDIIGGAVCGSASLVDSMMDLRQGALMLLGPTMNPKIAFELSQRIPHLGLRMKEHCRRALEYATRMKKRGLKVIYPGLKDHPQHQLFQSMANKDYGFGGILSVDLITKAAAYRLMDLLQNPTKFGFIAVSLGYYETLMSCPGSSISSKMNVDEKKLAGISPGLLRMSVGYIGTLKQKWSQFEKAISMMEEESQSE